MRKYFSAKDLAKITKPGRYAVGHGAYLQIANGGTRSWLLRYRSGTKCTSMGLGSCEYVSLGTAMIGSPADFGRLIADETEKWDKVIRAANTKPE
jgi:hypothetical protein